MNGYCMHVLRSGFQGDTLCHYGKEGMRWGIRRYQPYGWGYDSDHQGREIGLAARMGGQGSSYSSVYGRGASTADRVRNAARAHGRKAQRAIESVADKVNQGLSKAERKAREAADRAKKSFDSYRARKAASRSPVYDEETNQTLVRRASQLGGRESKLGSMHDKMYKELQRRGLSRIREKERSGVYRVHQTANSTTTDIHDWAAELTPSEQRALDSMSRLREKAGAKAAYASRKAWEYSSGLQESKKTPAQKTKSELYATLFSSQEMARKTSLALRAKISDVAKHEYQRELANEDARRRLQELNSRKLTEALSIDTSEDYQIVREFFKTIMG